MSLLLLAMPSFLFSVAMPGAPSSVLAVAMPSFLILVVWPGAPSSDAKSP